MVVDPKIDRIYPREFPSIVEVELKDGRKITERVDAPKGSPENPLSNEEVKAKFLNLATTSLPLQKAEEIIALVENIENLPSIRQLTTILY